MQTKQTAPRRVLGVTSVVASGALAGSVGLTRVALTAWSRWAGPGWASLDDAATALASSAALVLLLVWSLRLCCALLAHLPGSAGRAARRVAGAATTTASRRLAAALLGATAAGLLVTGPASAAGPAGPHATGPVASPPQVPRPAPGFVATMVERVMTAEPPGWTPTRPVVRPQAVTSLVARGGGGRQPGHVVVHRGDTLWDIAARQLGPGASDAEVALAWPAWHEGNRAVLGDDPDVILPGQVLRVPRAVAR